MMLWKCCTQYASKFGKLSSGTGLKKVSFHSNSKERQYKRMLKLLHNCPHITFWQSNAQNSPSQASTVHELWISDVQAGFIKGRGTGDQTANIHQIIKKAREFQKNIYYCFIDYSKAFYCVDHSKLGKFFKTWESRPPDLPPGKPVCRSRNKS